MRKLKNNNLYLYIHCTNNMKSQQQIVDLINYHNLNEEVPLEIEEFLPNFVIVKNNSNTVFSLTYLEKRTGLSIMLKENKVVIG